ncbi:carbonic anhydrase [Kribbella sp. NPDC026611]|uniref:carbonic anhydrase n=1 Tax=Kribbella sp. NPDC026611 TaxID=3154911 RepID=UPI0033D7347D
MTTPPREPDRRRFLVGALGAALAAGALGACADSGTTAPTATGSRPPEPREPTPTASVVADGNEALARLMAGNARFVAAQEQDLDEGIARRVAVSKGQHPFATIIGCVDSRVPIELVFDQGLGDLVVVRSAGEALDHSVTGSLEFGVAELHTPLLMVLGHQRCGALDATIKALDAGQRTADHGEIGYLVDALAPAVRQSATKPGDRLTNAIQTNVALTLGKLRNSPVIKPLEAAGKLTLVGAYYELDTGRVVLQP